VTAKRLGGYPRVLAARQAGIAGTGNDGAFDDEVRRRYIGLWHEAAAENVFLGGACRAPWR